MTAGEYNFTRARQRHPITSLTEYRLNCPLDHTPPTSRSTSPDPLSSALLAVAATDVDLASINEAGVSAEAETEEPPIPPKTTSS